MQLPRITAILDELTASVNTSSSEPFNFVYIDHEPGSVTNSSFQSLYISDIPDDIRISTDAETAVYVASEEIGKMIYTGKDMEQRQAVEITDFPEDFSAIFGGFSSWSTTTSIGSIEAQITDSDALWRRFLGGSDIAEKNFRTAPVGLPRAPTSVLTGCSNVAALELQPP